MGASVPDQALAVPATPLRVDGPAGFDPSRFRPATYDNKPRHMPKALRKELDALLNAARAHIDGLTDWRREQLFKAFLSVSPINCSWQHYGLAEIFVWQTASAIEARSDATGTGAAEGESAVPKGDAQ